MSAPQPTALRADAAQAAARNQATEPWATAPAATVRTATAKQSPASMPMPVSVPPVSPTPPRTQSLRVPTPRARRKAWSRVKAVGATLAVGVLVSGAVLPGLIDPEPATATAALQVDPQSFTASDTIDIQVMTRGDFSATSEDEVEASRQERIAAALASGLPLELAMNLPVATTVQMPMAASTYSLTDGFGAARPGRSHLGQDLAASIGTPIYAAIEGCVSLSTTDFGGYGETIQIESRYGGEIVSTLYSHLDSGSRAVEVGECVTLGQYLGDVGATGYVFGSCLHFEVHINRSPIDPLGWLEENVQ